MQFGVHNRKHLKMTINKFTLIRKAAYAAFLITSVYSIVLFSCGSQNELQQASIVVNYPMLQLDKSEVKLTNLEDTIPLYYYKKYRLFYIPYRKTLENDDSIVENKLMYNYFLLKDNSTQGFLFDSLSNNTNIHQIQADSFLLKRAYAAKFDIDTSLVKLTMSKLNGNQLIEKYTLRNLSNSLSFDTMCFFYNKKYNNIKYTFSRQLDSLKQMKLYKVQLLFNEKYDSSSKILMPKRMFLFELNEAKKGNPIQIKNIIENLIFRANNK
jgi:hypothetical protein